MLIEHSPAAAAAAPGPPEHVWYPVERQPLPACEAGFAAIVALLAPERERRGRRTRRDERLAVSLKGMNRQLWRIAHSQGSGKFACSQLLIIDSAFAEVMGWGRFRGRDGRWHYLTAPDRNGEVREVDRDTWVRNKRSSLYGWLKWLQAIGLIRVTGVRRCDGHWWRTEIELLQLPDIDPEQLRAAKRYVKGFGRREKRRQARVRVDQFGNRLPPRRRRLDRIRARAAKPNAVTRRRLALARELRNHDRKRRLGAEHGALIARERRAACAAAAASSSVEQQPLRHREHRFAAPPTGESTSTSETVFKRRNAAKTASCSSENELKTDALSEKSGASRRRRRRSGSTGLHSLSSSVDGLLTNLSATERTSVGDAQARSGSWEHARALRQALWRDVPHLLDRFAVQLQRDTQRVLSCEPGARLPHSVRVAAWSVLRHGLDELLADDALDPRRDLGTRSLAVSRRLDDAIALYERHNSARPDGWPASGAAALTVIAADHRPCDFAQDVKRLGQLAKRMAAAATLDDDQLDHERLERRRERALGRLGAAGGPDPEIVAMLQRDRVAVIAEEMAAWVDRRLRAGADYEHLRRTLSDHLAFLRLHPGHSRAANAYVAACEERIYQHRYAHQRNGTWRENAPQRSPYSTDPVTQRAWTYGSEIAAGTWTLPHRWTWRAADACTS